MKSNSQKGVALVITLIFLSVITFMAVTFLVVSRRGSDQVTTLTQQATAKNAADAALQQANAQIMSLMFAQTNGFNFGLLVSTNFVSVAYDGGGVRNAITNVSYVEPNGAPLTAKDQPAMLNNLLILPRPPVFISTNRSPNASNEFRFYVDLNRNGVFDTNGVVPLLNNVGLPLRINGANILTNVVGDPEWIGVLDHPEQRHSASNLFVARYAFVALPIGNSLDINSIHNQAKEIGNNSDGFLRDQGVGSWEINLAGFLNGLNPGYWNYNFYDTNTTTFFPSTGLAFEDAAAILQYRYANSYNTLSTFNNLYGAAAGNIFDNDFIDGYARGPLMTNLSPLTIDSDGVNLPWSGADSTNHFFSTQDLFTSVPAPAVGVSFSNRLYSAGTNLDTFDRYTFYRMLSQMNFGSVPDATNKLNLNYKNIQGLAATNFFAWTPLDFFTNAADRLLRTHTNFIVPALNGAATNLSTGYIPIYPTNYYSPAVHRMLQLAANIYDASTNRNFDVASPNGFFPPSVFQPIYNKTIFNGITNIYISGYQEVTNFNQITTAPFDLRDSTAVQTLQPSNNVYGIPLIIGAKKGFPNFNEFSMQSTIKFARKIMINKVFAGNPAANWQKNIQYSIGISNALAVETWNSYKATYLRQINITGTNILNMVLTNELGTLTSSVVRMSLSIPPIPPNTWGGFNSSFSSGSFRIPLSNNVAFLPDSIYLNNGTLSNININPSSPVPIQTTAPNYPQPQFGVNITNRLQLIMYDPASTRVIDYVQFSGLDSQQNILSEVAGADTDDFGPGGVWDTNRTNNSLSIGALIKGVENQITVSQQDPTTKSVFVAPYTKPVTSADWNTADVKILGYNSVNAAATAFNDFYTSPAVATNLTKQVPFSPTRIITVYQTWQANDPLVHYTLSDLTGLGTDLGTPPKTNFVALGSTTNQILKNIGRVNDRYLPWNGTGNNLSAGVPAKYLTDPALKDPLVTRSDDWQFPTNKYPNIGWLGRVHRGTPWQTVYMKSSLVDPTNWQDWSGNINQFDAAAAQPTNDWAIFDLFTTAPNDNASRGQLSINQTNLAAWAAILDGVIVITNDDVKGFIPLVIDPNATNANGSLVQQIVNGINAQRVLTNTLGQPLYPGQVFSRLGDVLSTPQLTIASPFINTNGVTALNDAAYERIPQQIMSLLRVGTPRYVIFAYGQSLKPADHSILTSGPFLGMCTNYQITGEVATRAVVRFEPSSPINPADPFAPLNPTQNPAMPYRKDPINNLQPQIPPPRAVIESFTVMPPE